MAEFLLEGVFCRKHTNIQNHTNLGTHNYKLPLQTKIQLLSIGFFFKTFYSDEYVKHQIQGDKLYYVIYIVNHRQICFFLSELTSAARHTSFP